MFLYIKQKVSDVSLLSHALSKSAPINSTDPLLHLRPCPCTNTWHLVNQLDVCRFWMSTSPLSTDTCVHVWDTLTIEFLAFKNKFVFQHFLKNCRAKQNSRFYKSKMNLQREYTSIVKIVFMWTKYIQNWSDKNNRIKEVNFYEDIRLHCRLKVIGFGAGNYIERRLKLIASDYFSDIFLSCYA